MSKHKSEHVNKLMGSHGKTKSCSPADILMRGHHAMGGAANAMGNAVGNVAGGVGNAYRGVRGAVMGDNKPHFKTGGRVKRFEGGSTPQQPLMGADPATYSPNPLKRGGRACHALGGIATAGNFVRGARNAVMGDNKPQFRKGGRTRRAEGGATDDREHHFLGALAGAVLPALAGWAIPKIGNAVSGLFGGKATGGEVNTQPLKRAMGGAAKVRKGMMTEKGRLR